MATIKDTNYFVIHGWMLNTLGLSGNELMAYAIIYGFSQDETSEFSGSRSYLANFMNVSLRTVDNVLTSLQGKGLIAKKTAVISGVTVNSYTTCVNCTGGANFTGGSENFAHNKEVYIEDKENIKRNEEPNLTSLLTAPNETPIEQQAVKKGTETIVISALNDIYTKIEFMYKKCGYKDKLAKKDTLTRLKTICNNTNKSKRLHPLQILLSYGAYLAECRKYGKDVQYVKQSNFFLTSMVYDYAEKTASDFEQRVVEKYGDGWKKYKVVD